MERREDALCERPPHGSVQCRGWPGGDGRTGTACGSHESERRTRSRFRDIATWPSRCRRSRPVKRLLSGAPRNHDREGGGRPPETRTYLCGHDTHVRILRRHRRRSAIATQFVRSWTACCISVGPSWAVTIFDGCGRCSGKTTSRRSQTPHCGQSSRTSDRLAYCHAGDHSYVDHHPRFHSCRVLRRVLAGQPGVAVRTMPPDVPRAPIRPSVSGVSAWASPEGELVAGRRAGTRRDVIVVSARVA